MGVRRWDLVGNSRLREAGFWGPLVRVADLTSDAAVERVARRLCNHGYQDDTWNTSDEEARQFWREEAREAIRALLNEEAKP